ncbi:ABC transporter permease [Bifidobacterium sp. ESL0764]|uniref:ABC transporter permease n=1 Tax=Bifidobacterium sp. ESL0764 TaxID=2983228 RepID=UPI0023F7389A|nr:ABC transporter permease [Bifidobacterium sp. ESL0764]WEV65278.1 ABC transporter permease [Bifidobacterium sp. ESL0764]
MGEIATMVRLKWALTWATMRKSAWQTISFVLTALIALALVVGVGIFAWRFGPDPHVPGDMAPVDAMRFAMVLLGTLLTLMVVMLQAMMIGGGTAMGVRRFALFGIEDKTLQTGLIASSMAGIPAIVGMVALAEWAMAYRRLGAGMVVAALVSAPLAILTICMLGRMVTSLLDALVRTKHGQTVLYIVMFLIFLAIVEIPAMLGGGAAGGSLSENGSVEITAGTEAQISEAMRSLSDVTAVLSFTPLAAAFALPFDVASGAWGALLCRLVVLAATWVLCFAVGLWCLKHERLMSGSEDSHSATIKGIGAFGWMPDSPSGAVSARLVTYLRHDPRQFMFLLMPLLFAVIMLVTAHGHALAAFPALILAGLFMNFVESNGLAYDGQGFAMQVLAGLKGCDDRRGRVRVYAVFSLVYLALIALVLMVFTGSWANAGDWRQMSVFFGFGVAFDLVGLGVAEVMSCMAIYPVPSIDKPFATPQGRALAQLVMPLLYMLLVVVLVLPSGLMMLVPFSRFWPFWALGVCAVIDGVVVLAVGTWLGGKLLDRRQLKVLATLDSMATLQQ